MLKAPLCVKHTQFLELVFLFFFNAESQYIPLPAFFRALFWASLLLFLFPESPGSATGSSSLCCSLSLLSVALVDRELELCACVFQRVQ